MRRRGAAFVLWLAGAPWALGCGGRPAPPQGGSGRLAPLAETAPFSRILGSWSVEGSITFPFTSEEVFVAGCSVIDAKLGGQLIEERTEAHVGSRVSSQSWWYTRAPGESRIRAAHVDAETGSLALWEGEIHGDLYWIHDLSTPERVRFGNRTLSYRFRTHGFSEDVFHYDVDYSVDLGLTWFAGGKIIYTRSRRCEMPRDAEPEAVDPGSSP